MERISYHGWPDAWRLSNGETELIVVPAVGRILRYGPVGGPNLLWENPELRGYAGGAEDWANVGGDKVWPWPEATWLRGAGKGGVAPPPAWDGSPHRGEATGPLSLRLTSPEIAGHGLAVSREIGLAPRGSRVEIVTRLRAAPGASGSPVAVWSVTQMPPPERLLAEVPPGGEPVSWVRRWPWREEGRAGGLATFSAPEVVGKLGFDGRALGWLSGNRLVVQRLDAPADAAAWEPGTRAQAYWSWEPPGAPAGLPYVELEFTSPLVSPASPEAASTRIAWETTVFPGPRPEWPEVAAAFRAAARPGTAGPGFAAP